MKPKITIKMIADKANTSIGTVDRALSNRAGISKKTKERILRISQELGYSPNQMASALGRKRKIRIAAIYPSSPRYFYGHVERGVDKARRELEDYGIQVDDLLTPTIDLTEQERLLQMTDWGGYDGIAINVSGNTVSNYFDPLVALGKPVVTFNTDAPHSRRLFYVGHDLRKSGRLGGELMGKLLGGKGKVIVIGAFSAAPTFIERYGGFCEVIQGEYPDVTIFPCAESRASDQRAGRIILDMLREMPDINGIFSTGTTGTIGAAETLRQLDRRDITLIGYDLTERIVEAVNQGWCTAILYQDQSEQGYQAVRLLARHLLENWQPPNGTVIHGTQVLFKYNIGDYCDWLIPGEEESV